MPCFSCFNFHFHSIAGLSTVLWDDGDDDDDAHVACVGVVSSLVLLCGERSLYKATLHWAGPSCLYRCCDPLIVRGVWCAQTPETLEINFVNGNGHVYLFQFKSESLWYWITTENVILKLKVFAISKKQS